MNNANAADREIGMNKTGIGTSPLLSAAMLEGSTSVAPAPSMEEGAQGIAWLRHGYGTQSEPVGTAPPPSTMKGLFKNTVNLIKGQQPTVLLDKLGERLAFERSGVRMYAALIDKFDATGSWEGGPSREDLLTIQRDELRHFDLLRETLESLGADPTAMTPSADITGTEAIGILQVLGDPRTTLPQALHAILVIELTDNDGWEMLIKLAQSLGQDALAERLQGAMRDEARHLIQVRGWVNGEVLLTAKRALEPTH